MPIPQKIKIDFSDGRLPASSGVYLMKNKKGEIIYVGKAVSLKSRVSSYFLKNRDPKTAQLVSNISLIDFIKTDSVLEAIILEAELIKKYQPKYNFKEKSDKSWVYLVATKDSFPKLLIIRGLDLENSNRSDFQKIFGPFTNRKTLENALSVVRKIFPWSNCSFNKGKPCFYYHLGQCPGICLGKISSSKYKQLLKDVFLLFSGKKNNLLKKMEKEMNKLAKKNNFELATQKRNQIISLKHIRETSLLEKNISETPKENSDFFRIEGYDISNISGTDSVGSMVVFENGQPQKNLYRKFKIKFVSGINDTKMLAEIISRRLNHREWPLPNIFLIDGGRGQVNSARKIIEANSLFIPVLGIAKGAKRKNNTFILDRESLPLKEKIRENKQIFIFVRDESHRFAISYHRHLRGKIKK